MKVILCIVLGYLFGCINVAYFVTRYKKVDIRKSGSKNLGASNVKIAFGWKWGIFVGVCDMLKCFLAVMVARWVLPDIYYAPTLAGCSCILGHIFPFYLDFKAGKGFASYFGLMLALDWRVFLVAITLTILITYFTNYLSIASITMFVAYPAYLYLSILWGGSTLLQATIVAMVAFVMILKHKDNIVRLLHGNEITVLKPRKKVASSESAPTENNEVQDNSDKQ